MAGTKKGRKGSQKGGKKKSSTKKREERNKVKKATPPTTEEKEGQQVKRPVVMKARPPSNPLPADDSEDDEPLDNEPEKDLDLLGCLRGLQTDPVHQKPPLLRKQTAAEAQQQHEDKMFSEHKFKRRFNIDTFQSAQQHKAYSERTETFALAWSPDSRFIAAGCGDGSIRVYNSGGKQVYVMREPNADSLPVTALQFRPETAASTTKNVLCVTNADGTVSHWHMSSKTCLFTITEEENQIYTVDYRPDGAMFATGGRDQVVRVYDESTKTLLNTLKAGRTERTVGHSNRIYAVKFKPDDPNVLLSGGWDNTVQIWDLRANESVRSIYGPHICGSALDMDQAGKQILTASWRPQGALELWDFGTGTLMEDIPWSHPTPDGSKGRPDMLYSCQFSPDSSMIAAGGCGTNEAKIFSRGPPSKVLDRVQMGNRGVYSVAFSPNGRTLAVGGGDSIITTVDLV